MALSPLTLNVNSGIIGRAFSATISGQSEGSTIEVRPESSQGFYIANGLLKNEGLPARENIAILRETLGGEGYRDSRIIIPGSAAGFLEDADNWDKSREVAIGILGQSNERGSIWRTNTWDGEEYENFPLAFESQKNPGCIIPIAPAVTRNSGGWWCYVRDELWDWGYDVTIVNGAIGAASMVRQFAGQMQFRSNSNNSVFRKRDAYPGREDMGYSGDIINPVGNKIFVATTANDMILFHRSITPIPWSAYSYTELDFIDSTPFANRVATAGSAPNFDAATTVGDTVTDGGVVWTLQSLTNPYGGAGGTIFNEDTARGVGFDPFGCLARLHAAMQKVQAKRKIIYIANGQSDFGQTVNGYSSALQACANYFLTRGYEVMIGLTMNAPGVAGGTTSNWANLVSGVQAAITALQATYPDKVHAGADLYTEMGTSGPIGGRLFTGAISGSTLTVSATTNNGAIEVGHTITDVGGNIKGVVSALGTGTGGTGTYTLAGAVTTSSATLRAQGAFFQSIDGTHVNAAGAVGPDVAGVSCVGKYVTDAIKAVLPQR